MNEAQVRHDLIDPALKAAGWELLPAKVTVEQTIAPGPVSQEDGQSHNPEFACYGSMSWLLKRDNLDSVQASVIVHVVTLKACCLTAILPNHFRNVLLSGD